MKDPEVSVLLLTRGNPEMLKTCLEALGPSLEGVESEVLVIEHETSEALKVIEEVFPGVPGDLLQPGYLAIPDEPKQTFSSLNNEGVRRCSGKYILLLNNDVVLQPGAVKAMKAVLDEREDVGVVGAKLLFPEGTIQHIGVVFMPNGSPYHLGHGQSDDGTYLPATRSDYYDAVTFACAMIRRSVWDQAGGLDEEYIWNYDDIDFCLKAREAGWKVYCTADAVAFHLEGQSREFVSEIQETRLGPNLKILWRKWIESGKLEKVLGHRLPMIKGPSQINRVRVVFVPADENCGISVWRIMQPARKLAQKGLVNMEVLGPIAHNLDHAMRTFDVAEVVVWQAHFSEGVRRFAKMGNVRPWVMLYEYDDHPLYLSPYASAYGGLGTHEQKIRTEGGEEMWIWRDGENGFDVARNRENRQRQMEIISQCDGLTTTTVPLVKFFERYNQRVWQLPNCIDFEVYKGLDELYEPKGGRPFRIGWWGGDNHWHDVSTIGKPLTAFVNSNEDVRMVFLGAFYRGPFKGIDMNRVIEGDWVHAEAWPYRLANAGIDLAIVPLADPAIPHMRFNHFKSDIKWLEASALKIPSLVQEGREAYLNCRDRENCLTYDGEEEFLEKLTELKKDPQLRKKLGQAAYDWARAFRDLDKEVHRWAEVYEEAKRMPRGLPEPEVPAEALRAAGSGAVAEGS